MAEKTLFSVKDINVIVSSDTNEEINALLSSTIVGSEGGIQYKMRNIAARIAGYGKDIRFIAVYLRSSLAAVIGACYRECTIGTLTHKCTYLRFLSFRQQYQTERFRPGLRRNKKENAENDSFRNRVLRLFGKPHLYDFPGVEETSSHLLYCFVEGKNERSQNLIRQAGFQYLRSFSTLTFSRFSLKPDARVSVATEEERPEILAGLRELYKGHSFYFDDKVFHADSYYVLRDKGRIIAGVSAIPTEYILHNVPGAGGWIMMNILPFAPFFRRLFNPGLFRFVSLGYLFFEPGKEDAITPLLESVCKECQLNVALTWVDTGSPIYKTISDNVTLGILNPILSSTPAQVWGRFVNYGDDEKEAFAHTPAYISGFDFT